MPWGKVLEVHSNPVSVTVYKSKYGASSSWALRCNMGPLPLLFMTLHFTQSSVSLLKISLTPLLLNLCTKPGLGYEKDILYLWPSKWIQLVVSYKEIVCCSMLCYFLKLVNYFFYTTLNLFLKFKNVWLKLFTILCERQTQKFYMS